MIDEKTVKTILEVIKEYPYLILTGSLALKFQEVDIGRDAIDIDFVCPYHGIWKKPDAWKDISEERDDYEPGKFIVSSYIHDGIKIDVIHPETMYYDMHPLIWRSKLVRIKGSAIPQKLHRLVRMICKIDIIRAKVGFSFSNSGSAPKHKNDLIEIFTRQKTQS